MNLFNILQLVDCEQNVKIVIENNAMIEAEVSGDQESIMKMLSSAILARTVGCIAARDNNVLYIWLEDEKDENA